MLSKHKPEVSNGTYGVAAYILHRLGYDVWMGNFRGNRYSRTHRDKRNMDPDRNVRQFWDFSFHEKGVYDVPATIDYILERTGHQDLLYVGHSMGTTAFFVMLSERPAYNLKVRAMSALAPVSFMTQVGGGRRLAAGGGRSEEQGAGGRGQGPAK